MNTQVIQNKHRLTQRQKYARNNQWYKDQANLLDTISLNQGSTLGFGEVSEYKRMKANYDLFNNIIDMKDFAYVCKPFGAEVGELPANFANRDIVSGKIKVLLGMEMKMPFQWKIAAVNEEATTRKEEEEFGRIRDYVTSEVMKPIRMQAEKAAKEKAKGSKLTSQELQDLQQEIEDEVQSKTPDKVRQYMAREHQDPAEALSRQILEYLIPEKRVAHKFNKGWKHSNLSGTEIYWVGTLNGEPDFKVVNPLFFDHDKSHDTDFIEDGEWAVCEYRMTPSEVIANFGSELKEEDIDRIYQYANNPSTIADADFTFNTERANEAYTVRVLHCNWKSLRPIRFLTYKDENGKEQMMIVEENYKLDPNHGDIRLETEWIPEAHECYKILDDIYVLCRPVPGQHKDIDNLYECKLSYYGAATDSLNSPTTSPMDRMKTYQYFYNIIIYRIEMLMASDKGKILAGNINAVPKSSGIDMNKFLYFMEANKIAWGNPNEEGNRGTNNNSMSNLFSVLDLSLVSDIFKYMQVAESIEKKCGACIGVTPQMEAQIAAGDAVTNTQQNLVQASYIIQPYFELHNTVKANVLQALVDEAKFAYSQGQPRKLTYILDDMSVRTLTVDQDLLANSRYGLYVANSAKAADAKRAVENLSQAALQNQQADLSDIIKIIKSDSINEAEELLEAAQGRKAQELQMANKMKERAEKQAAIAEQEEKDKDRQHELAKIRLKEELTTEREIQKQTILSLGFNEEKDMDRDGTPDVLEVAQFGVDTSLKQRKQTLDERKFEHQRANDKERMKLDKEKNDIARIKKTSNN